MALPLMANHVPVNICHIECYLDFGNPFDPLKVFYTQKNLFHSPSFRSPFNSLPQFDPRTVVSSLRKERRKKEVENDDQKEMTKK